MTDCREQSWLFQDLGGRKVEVDFGGAYLSSDGGGLILRELERHSGLIRDFAGCFVDYRDQRYIEYSVQELISQRLHGLVLGYEDLNDHDHLRLDPIHGLIAGKSDSGKPWPNCLTQKICEVRLPNPWKVYYRDCHLTRHVALGQRMNSDPKQNASASNN
jgi:Transposase DDE domain group 1